MKLSKLFLSSLFLFCFSLNSASAQTILATDFNREFPYHDDYRKAEKWVDLTSLASKTEIKTIASWGKWGVMDVVNTSHPSDGLQMIVDNPSNIKNWDATLISGLREVKNQESNIEKLTISFDHWVSSVRPVEVVIESFNDAKIRTGGLTMTVYPATAKHFLRSSLELSSMKPVGKGKFNAKDQFIQLSFSIADTNLAGKQELRIDNFSYASAAYYISPNGKDSNDGRTEKTAFAHPQAALNKAKPGDVILMMNGEYVGAKGELAVASFVRSGTPASWITLKNYPGHKPVILCKGQDGVLIAQGDARTYTNAPTLSYLEVRGLIIRGNSEDILKQKHPDLGTSTPITETTGININGSYAPTRMYHHIRLADCITEYCGADGVYVDFSDYVTIENCIMRYNCYTSVHWCISGLTVMHYADFDKVDNVTKMVVRGNQMYGNLCKTYKKTGPYKIFNGNGILFDASWEAYIAPDFYLGRSLVQNNLVYGNGGGGIQMWGAHRIDVVNNTLYFNGVTPELKWGNMGFDYCDDIRVINNIVVAQPDRPLDFWMASHVDVSSNITRINNLYFGGIQPNIKGVEDIVTDPLFVNPSLDPAVADFRLKTGSPAINSAATNLDNTSLIDLFTKNRTIENAKIDRGAIKFE
jgi:hypothetical protein